MQSLETFGTFRRTSLLAEDSDESDDDNDSSCDQREPAACLPREPAALSISSGHC